MAYLLGSIFGALVATYLLSALMMWLFRSMGETPTRVIVSFAVAFAAFFILSGLGSADGGPFNPWKNFPFYATGFVIWFAVQWFAMKKRAASAVIKTRQPMVFD